MSAFSLRQRQLLPELMDEPALPKSELARALRGLQRINRISASAPAIWRQIRQLTPKPAQGPLRLLDVATGSGDVPRQLHALAKKSNLDIEITGCDINPESVELAASECGKRDLASGSLQFVQADVLSALPDGRFDILLSSLFLHHLEAGQVVSLLQRMAERANVAVMISDLRRGWWGYLLAWLGTRLLSRSRIVHIDGPRSVRNAFTINEIAALASKAGLEDCRIKRCWPARFLLVWERS